MEIIAKDIINNTKLTITTTTKNLISDKHDEISKKVIDLEDKVMIEYLKNIGWTALKKK